MFTEEEINSRMAECIAEGWEPGHPDLREHAIWTLEVDKWLAP